MADDPKTTPRLFEPGERVRCIMPRRGHQTGRFSHIGTNGLAQVIWDGNKHPAYIAPTLIEPVRKDGFDGR